MSSFIKSLGRVTNIERLLKVPTNYEPDVLEAIQQIGADGRLLYLSGKYIACKGEERANIDSSTVSRLLKHELIDRASSYAGAFCLTQMGKAQLGES